MGHPNCAQAASSADRRARNQPPTNGEKHSEGDAFSIITSQGSWVFSYSHLRVLFYRYSTESELNSPYLQHTYSDLPRRHPSSPSYYNSTDTNLPYLQHTYSASTVHYPVSRPQRQSVTPVSTRRAHEPLPPSGLSYLPTAPRQERPSGSRSYAPRSRAAADCFAAWITLWIIGFRRRLVAFQVSRYRTPQGTAFERRCILWTKKEVERALVGARTCLEATIHVAVARKEAARASGEI